MTQQYYISGQQAWDKLISLSYTGGNSYQNFFRNWDIFYRRYWKSLENENGQIKDDELTPVSFNWIINRQYNTHGWNAVETPPYYELCVSMPPEPKDGYRPPRFIWNNQRGLQEIFLSPKVSFDI